MMKKLISACMAATMLLASTAFAAVSSTEAIPSVGEGAKVVSTVTKSGDLYKVDVTLNGPMTFTGINVGFKTDTSKIQVVTAAGAETTSKTDVAAITFDTSVMDGTWQSSGKRTVSGTDLYVGAALTCTTAGVSYSMTKDNKMFHLLHFISKF